MAYNIGNEVLCLKKYLNIWEPNMDKIVTIISINDLDKSNILYQVKCGDGQKIWCKKQDIILLNTNKPKPNKLLIKDELMYNSNRFSEE